MISTFILWFPFIIHAGNWMGLSIPDSNFQYIYRNFDGLLYIVPAKTFYNPRAIEQLGLETNLSPSYFAAHLPLYPFLIRIFAPVIGLLKSMVFVNILATVCLGILFYHVLRKFQLTKHPLILTGVFLFLPRFLVVRSIGAPESLFMFLLLLTLYFFEKKHYVIAGIIGALATMTKTPGILLFMGCFMVFAEKLLRPKSDQAPESIKHYQILSLILIPFGLITVFIIYLFQYQDFLAYFHSGDNVHLVSLFSAFNFQKIWVGTAWLEDIVLYFFLYTTAIITLKDFKYRSFFYFGLVFLIASLFVQHRDISRYMLPLWPLTCIAFERFLTSKKFLVAFVLLLPAIYLYAWNFLLYNVMPISNWQPFL